MRNFMRLTGWRLVKCAVSFKHDKRALYGAADVCHRKALASAYRRTVLDT